MATHNAILQDREGCVPPLFKATSSNIRSPTSFVQHFKPWNLGEPRNLIEQIAAVELDSGGYGSAAERLNDLRDFAYTIVAVAIAEVPSALEEAIDGGLAAPGAGFVESGLGGLWNQRAKKGWKRLGVNPSWIWEGLLGAALVDQRSVIRTRFCRWY